MPLRRVFCRRSLSSFALAPFADLLHFVHLHLALQAPPLARIIHEGHASP